MRVIGSSIKGRASRALPFLVVALGWLAYLRFLDLDNLAAPLRFDSWAGSWSNSLEPLRKSLCLIYLIGGFPLATVLVAGGRY